MTITAYDTLKQAPSGAGEATGWRANLPSAIQSLRHSREVSHNIRHEGRFRRLPSPRAVQIVVEKLAAGLFPSHFGRADLDPELIDEFVALDLSEALASLEEQVTRELVGMSRLDETEPADARGRAAAIIADFTEQLPEIRNLLVGDLIAAYAGDPAATNFPEIMLSYPGVLAVLHYRIARALYLLGATLVARLIARIAHAQTAIDIHPGANIGRSFFIDHGTGVVVGETAVIGDRVRLYQGVTLGAKSFPADEAGRVVKGQLRHPVVEDDVVIYAGATILGRITIGHHSIIGGNVWLTDSIPPHTNLTQGRVAQQFSEQRHEVAVL